MPIRAENKARYPKDWKAISLRIRERAGQKCEKCSAPNGQLIIREQSEDYHFEPTYITVENQMFSAEDGRLIGGAYFAARDTSKAVKVVLTVAHLGLPAHLPFFFHVTRDTITDEVIEAIGVLMPIDPKLPEWRQMMHRRATANFLRGSSASGAGFFISIPSGTTRLAPCWPIISGPQSTIPVWVRLTAWSLLTEPCEAALVAAEAASSIKVKPTDIECIATSLACSASKPPLGSAYCFRMTGIRTSLFAIRRLLRSDWEPLQANDAVQVGRGFSRSCHASLYYEGSLYHIDNYPENCADDNLRAWCQRCHNAYDAKMRANGIAGRRKSTMAAGDLFGGQK